MISLTEPMITREQGGWVVRFRLLEAWFAVDPSARPDDYADFEVADLYGAFAYASSFIALAASSLRVAEDLDDCGDVGIHELALYASGRIPRTHLEAALAEAARTLAGDDGYGPQPEGTPADILRRRQHDRARRDRLGARIRALAGGNEELCRGIGAQLPDTFDALDDAESALDALEAAARAALIQRMAVTLEGGVE